MARYYAQCEEVMVNQAKWSAARNWCSDRGVNWLVLTEKNALAHLFKTEEVHFCLDIEEAYDYQ